MLPFCFSRLCFSSLPSCFTLRNSHNKVILCHRPHHRLRSLPFRACWIVRYAFSPCATTVSRSCGANCQLNNQRAAWLQQQESQPIPEETAGDRVLAWCYEHHYLDDERFASRFLASRGRKGYGPARIRQELNQKGVARESIEKAMRESDIDWCELAKEQAIRKYGEPLPREFSEKVKIQRFLLYRGFLMEDIQDIWRNFAD